MLGAIPVILVEKVTALLAATNHSPERLYCSSLWAKTVAQGKNPQSVSIKRYEPGSSRSTSIVEKQRKLKTVLYASIDLNRNLTKGFTNA